MRRVYLSLFLTLSAIGVSFLPEYLDPPVPKDLPVENEVIPEYRSVESLNRRHSVGLGEGVTLLVVDSSGSMRKNEKRSQEALDALLLLQRENIGLVTFGDEARMVVSPEQPVEELQAVMATLPSRGGSNLYAGLQTAMDWLRDHHKSGNVLLVSDGSANVGEVDVGKILALAAQADNENVHFYVAESGDPEGTLLRDMAEISHGFDWSAGRTLDFSRAP